MRYSLKIVYILLKYIYIYIMVLALVNDNNPDTQTLMMGIRPLLVLAC